MDASELPQQGAGVAVPQRVRRSGNRLLRLLSHPLVSDTLAGAVIAGASALAEGKGRAAAGKAAGLGAAAAAVKASKGPNRVAVALGIALIELAAGQLLARQQCKSGKRKGRKRAAD